MTWRSLTKSLWCRGFGLGDRTGFDPLLMEVVIVDTMSSTVSSDTDMLLGNLLLVGNCALFMVSYK